MVEAAASGCIDYTKADSEDHKFLLKELWMCESLATERSREYIKEHLAAKRELLAMGPEAIEGYFDFLDNVYRKTLMPWDVDAGHLSDSERYNELFGEVSEEEHQELETFLDKKAKMAAQQSEGLKRRLEQAEQLVQDKFKHRIK